MTTRPINYLGAVSSRQEATLNNPADAALIVRGRPRWFLISCPCGCGEIVALNMDPRNGPVWHLFDEAIREISLYPSVRRKSGCKSHFILWRGRAYVFGGREDVEFRSAALDPTDDLLDLVSAELSTKRFKSYESIADTLGEVPWDVLAACRRLVGLGVALEGVGDDEDHFRRRG